MPSRRPSSARTGNRDVSGRLYLQPVFSPSRVEQSQTFGDALNSGDGCRANRSPMEYCGTPQLSDRSASLGGTETSRTASHPSFVHHKHAQASRPSFTKGSFMFDPQLAGFYQTSSGVSFLLPIVQERGQILPLLSGPLEVDDFLWRLVPKHAWVL